MNTPPAFLSYCRADSEFAFRLARDLKAAGAGVWMDQLDIEPGTPWDGAVEKALEQSRHMLVLLSPVSVASENVRDEVSFALGRNKKVIPVLYRECEVPFRLARLQHVDFTVDYAHGLQTLVKALSGPSTATEEVAVPVPAEVSPGRPGPQREPQRPAIQAEKPPVAAQAQAKRFPLWAAGGAGLVVVAIVVWFLVSSHAGGGAAQPAPVTNGMANTEPMQNAAPNMPAANAANGAGMHMERNITGRWFGEVNGQRAVLSIDRMGATLQGQLEYVTNDSQHHITETMSGRRTSDNVVFTGTSYTSDASGLNFGLDTLNLNLNGDDSTLAGDMSDKSGSHHAVSFSRAAMRAPKK